MNKHVKASVFCHILCYALQWQGAHSLCSVEGASYGNLEAIGNGRRLTNNREVHEWAPLVGIACADSGYERCYSGASVWSEVAIQHGNNPVNSESECEDLCDKTEQCDVWTYWPNGIGSDIETPTAAPTAAPTECDICPGTVFSDKEYCTTGDDCRTCSDFYDYVKTLAGEKTCAELKFAFIIVANCCDTSRRLEEGVKYEQQAPGACELFSAAPEKDHVLAFTKGGHVTAPKTCDSTVWLPFLESTKELPSNTEEEIEGQNCWISDHSYGRIEDGACDNAKIVAVHAQDAILELGKSQGWWATESATGTITLESYFGDNIPSPSYCLEACMTNQDCGGWELINEACVLKSRLSCGPTLTSSNALKSFAGVNGCINPDSEDPAVQNALDMDTSDHFFLDCSRPRCTKPHSEGSWVEDTFIPDYKAENACWYKQYTPEDLYSDCAQDRWIVISGGSNTLSFFIQMVNLFAPVRKNGAEKRHFISYGDTIAYSIIDVVIKKGSMPVLSKEDDGVLYVNKMKFCDVDDSLQCAGSLVFQGGQATWGEGYVNALHKALGAAPYESGATRITLVVGQMWSHSEAVLNSISGPGSQNGWERAKIMFYGQAMIWYPCFLEKWCQDETLGDTSDKMLDVYRSDLGNLLETGKETCSTSRFDCFFATHAYGKGISSRAQKMIDTLEEMTTRYSWANYIDYNGIIDTKEIIDGHLIPSMMLPIQTMMWNTVCPGPSVGCPEATQTAPACWSDCSDRGGGESCGECKPKDWVCMNSRYCDYQVLSPIPWHIAVGAPPMEQISNDIRCFDKKSIGVPYTHDLANTRLLRLAETEFDESRILSGSDEDKTCTRIWCGTVAQGWLIGILLFLVGLSLVIVPQYLCGQESKPGEAETNNKQNQMEQIRIRQTTEKASDSTSQNSTAELSRLRLVDESAVSGGITLEEKVECNRNVEMGSHAWRPQSIHDEIDTDSFGQRPEDEDEEIDVDEWEERDAASWEQSPSDEEDQGEAPWNRESYLHRPNPHSDSGIVESALEIEGTVEGAVTIAETNIHGSSPKKEYLGSLGVARLLASQHIVLGHLFAKGVTADVYFFGWGFTWVPWFFVLSGYVLTHARLNSSNPANTDGPFTHIGKRLGTIFPTYAFGILLTLILRIVRDKNLPRYDTLIAQSFLIQSWIPVWTENALLLQCWFLSNLVVYWAIFGFMYKQVRAFSLHITIMLLTVICFLPWLTIIVPALFDGIDYTWYGEHKLGKTETSTDIWTIMLKFNPIFYVHVFIFGMLLAVLRNNLKNGGSSYLAKLFTFFTQCGATLGYLGLILIFSVEAFQPPAYKLSTRLSILLPLQGLIMLGLSPLPNVIDNGGFQDPLARLFSCAPSWIGDMSYCQYVLQFAMYNLFPITNIDDPSFFLYLWGASLLCYKLIQYPAAQMWRSCLLDKKNEQGLSKKYRVAIMIFVPSTILTLILIIVKAAYDPTEPIARASEFTPLPQFVRIDNEAVDMELNWPMAINDDSFHPINPSMLFRDDGNGVEWIRTVRAHYIERESLNGVFEGIEVTEEITRFHSSILLKRESFSGDLGLGFDESSISGWGLNEVLPLEPIKDNIISHKGKDKSWVDLCEPSAMYNEVNKTLSRKLVTGPEDPKLFEVPADSNSGSLSWSLTFSSFPPASLLNEQSSIDACKWQPEAVMQMYLSADGPALASEKKAQGVRLDCGNSQGMEKNWIAFYHDGNLYYVYSIEPHVVVNVRPSDGACVEQYSTSSKDLRRISLELRGSATAIRYSDTEYLALMHINDPTQGYSTMAYTFKAEPPFTVQRISKALPLHYRAFASSLTVYKEKVLIGYGENDKKSRVLVMSRDYLESLFDWCS
mmetsp:Transcript_27935/g.41247  ORF Transcript_27935/g.41247 Transcript_27935/m.41247 type:complete len:1849 (+) Transcript_27935:56-5602(+)